MKLEGKWYVSVYDDRATSTYPDATDVKRTQFPVPRISTTPDGKIHVTSYPVNMRAVQVGEHGKPFEK
jgi:hypothetical protein